MAGRSHGIQAVDPTEIHGESRADPALAIAQRTHLAVLVKSTREGYSTVTLLARLRGLSTLQPRRTAAW